MLAKFSVDNALMKANTHIKNNEIAEAHELYQAVLRAFPKNIRAQKGLATLRNHTQNIARQAPLSELIKNLINLYNQRQLDEVVKQAKSITKQYPQAFVVWNILGAANNGLGIVREASEAFKKVTELNPNYADGFNNLGVTLKDLSKLDEAINAYKKAIALKPDYPDAYNNMGNALKHQNRFDEAIEAYKKALELRPHYAEAYNNIGVALKNLGKLEEATDAYKKAISIEPNYADAYYNFGVICNMQSNLEEAIKAYDKVVLLQPNYVEAFNNKGDILHIQGKLDEAIEAYNKAVSIEPDSAGIYNNIGNVFKDKGKLKESLKAYNKALLLKPDYAEVYNNIGVVFKNNGKLKEALKAYKKAVSLKTNYAEAFGNMGLNLNEQGKLEASLEAYNKAIAIKPNFAEAHQNMSFTLLNANRIKEGLEKYEWRLKTDGFKLHQRNFTKPLWDGKQSLHNKTILIWCEQGVGDTLRWSWCLSILKEKAKYCILECQEKLIPLLKRSFPNVEIRPENRRLDAERDDFDYHLPMGSLYKHFINQIKLNDRITSHLIPNPERVSFWKKKLNLVGKGPYIGIGWKSTNMSPDKLPNNAPLMEWSPILNIPGITFINLQYADFKKELNIIEEKLGVKVHNFDDLDHYNNIDDVSALCASLDAVISTNMTVPIISGGVGTPTKIANYLQSSCNNILLSPINSSVDIFERNLWEPWDNVFNLIAKDILKLKKHLNKIKK